MDGTVLLCNDITVIPLNSLKSIINCDIQWDKKTNVYILKQNRLLIIF